MPALRSEKTTHSADLERSIRVRRRWEMCCSSPQFAAMRNHLLSGGLLGGFLAEDRLEELDDLRRAHVGALAGQFKPIQAAIVLGMHVGAGVDQCLNLVGRAAGVGGGGEERGVAVAIDV